jgi:hypothetical protein
MILNNTIRFEMAPENVRKAFRRQQATKKLLHSGHGLYKFTAYPLFRPDGSVTPFWFSVIPITPGDTGLAGLQQRSVVLTSEESTTARARGAVTRQWNPMTGLLRARLLAPVYGFIGQCSGQPIDEAPWLSNIFFIGGAWQLWIPNLGAQTIAEEARA